MDDLIIYKCQICKKHFILLESEVEHSERESKFITCPYYGKHKDITVIGKIDRYGEIHKCMEQRSYRKEAGVIKQR